MSVPHPQCERGAAIEIVQSGMPVNKMAFCRAEVELYNEDFFSGNHPACNACCT